MQYTINEKNVLEKVNEIGIKMDAYAEENFIFVILSPYLDQLMMLLKRLKPTEMQMIFMQYEGVMKVMRMVEEGAQAMEKELGLK